MDLYNTNGRVVLNITEAKATGFIFNTLWLRGAGRSIIGGGGHIHIFVFTDCKNN